jgi:hypothetical protein
VTGEKMRALSINCNSVRNSVTAGVDNIIDDGIFSRYDTKCIFMFFE